MTYTSLSNDWMFTPFRKMPLIFSRRTSGLFDVSLRDRELLWYRCPRRCASRSPLEEAVVTFSRRRRRPRRPFFLSSCGGEKNQMAKSKKKQKGRGNWKNPHFFMCDSINFIQLPRLFLSEARPLRGSLPLRRPGL